MTCSPSVSWLEAPLWRSIYGDGYGTLPAAFADHARKCLTMAARVYLPLHLAPALLGIAWNRFATRRSERSERSERRAVGERKEERNCLKGAEIDFRKEKEEEEKDEKEKKKKERMHPLVKLAVNVVRSSAFLGGNVAIAGLATCILDAVNTRVGLVLYCTVRCLAHFPCYFWSLRLSL